MTFEEMHTLVCTVYLYKDILVQILPLSQSHAYVLTLLVDMILGLNPVKLNPLKSGKAVTQDQTYSLEFGFVEALTCHEWGFPLQEKTVIVWKNPRWISPL